MWYLPSMRRNVKSITTSPEIIETIAGLTRANFEMHTKLIPWLAANEEAQRRFRNVVISKLLRIEAYIALLYPPIMAHNQSVKWYDPEKLMKNAKAAEEFITTQTYGAGLQIMQEIHRQEPKAATRHDRRKRWHGWEI